MKKILIRKSKGVAAVIAIITLSTMSITGCNKKDVSSDTNSNTQEEQSNKQEVVKNPFDIDCELYPYLKFSTSGEVAGSKSPLVQMSFALNDSITNDLNTIAFDLRNKINSNNKPVIKNLGKFMIIDYKDDYLYIAEAGKEIKDSFVRITYNSLGFDKTAGAFLNSNGVLFILYQGKLARIKDSTNVGIFNMFETSVLSENGRYIASQIKGNNYLLADLDTGESSRVEISEDMMDSTTYRLDNYWVSNNGELLIAENIGGKMIAIGWNWRELKNHDFYAFLTGLKINNVYKANFTGIPMYTNNDYLIYSSQYELNKVSANGSEVLFKYIDFKEETYGYDLFNDSKTLLDKRVSNKIVFTDGKKKNIFDPSTLTWSNN